EAVEIGVALIDLLSGDQKALIDYAAGKALDKLNSWIAKKLLEIPAVRRIMLKVVGTGMSLALKAVEWTVNGALSTFVATTLTALGQPELVPAVPFAMDALLDWVSTALANHLGTQALKIAFIKKFVEKQVVGRLTKLVFDYVKARVVKG